MQHSCFVETANTPILVVDIEPQLVMNEPLATKLRKRLSGRLGGMPVLLRCRIGNSFWFNGERNLWRYAVDPIVDVLPSAAINIDSLLDEAA
jgi:hypothetical protein